MIAHDEGNPARGDHGITTRDLRGETRLAASGGPCTLPAPRRHWSAPARRAIRRPEAVRPRLAGASRSDLPHRRGRRRAGGGPERVEPGEPARAILGFAHAP